MSSVTSIFIYFLDEKCLVDPLLVVCICIESTIYIWMLYIILQSMTLTNFKVLRINLSIFMVHLNLKWDIQNTK